MKKVFVLEDDKEILSLIAILLKQINCDFQSNTKASGSYEMIEAYQPDLLVLDYWLEDSTADELIKQIKTSDTLKDMPIILISAVSDIMNIINNFAIDGYLKKPFDILEFQNKVRNFIA